MFKYNQNATVMLRDNFFKALGMKPHLGFISN